MAFSLKSWIVEKLNPAQPAIASLQPFASPETTVDYQQAYRDIEVVNRAIQMIVSACVEVPFMVDGGPQKKLNKLLNVKPNPFEDRTRLFRRAFLDFILDGNAFFYYDGTNLYLLPANDVEVVPDKKTFISHYNYLVTNQTSSDIYRFGTQTRKSETIRFECNEIIHIMNENESSIFRGTSKVKPIIRLIELYYYMINFQRQFFKNNALPGLVLSTDNVLSKRVKDRLLSDWKSTYTTLFDGARNPAILDGGLKIDKFSATTFAELDFENSIERIQQDMAKALGVPYVLMKSGNNANIEVNQKLFYLHTILPILDQFASAFSLFFNTDMLIRPDRLAVPALQPDNKAQSLYYSTLLNNGIITVNESRIGLRMPTIDSPENNELRIPQNITGSAANPAIGGRPKGEDQTTPESTPSNADEQGQTDE